MATAVALGKQPPAIRLVLLGTPRLVLADRTTVALERRMAALLAKLAVDGPTPRAHAAAMLWPEADDKSARNNLRQRLFRLRQAAQRDVVVPDTTLALADGIGHDLSDLSVRLADDPAKSSESRRAYDRHATAAVVAKFDIVRNIPYHFRVVFTEPKTMPEIREIATVTSKGQITLPKPIRQALGVSVGGQVAFDLRRGEVIVTRAEGGDHEDPAIEAFLGLLERDIRAGKRVRTLPDGLARAMLANARRTVDLDEAIEGKVAL